MPATLPQGSAWTDKVSFKYSLPQEMFWSLHVLADPSHHQDRLDWCLQVTKVLPATLAADMEYFAKNYDEWGCFLQLVESLESDKTITWDQVHAELARMGQALFVYFALERTVKVGELIRHIRQPALIDQFLKTYQSLDGEMVRGLLTDPEKVRTTLINVLDKYWQLVFAQEATTLEPYLFTSLQDKVKLLRTAGMDDFLASLGLGITVSDNKLSGRAIVGEEELNLELTFDEVDKILVLPTVFATPHLFPVFHEKTLVLRYPLVYPNASALALSQQELLTVLKALSNGTRLQILQLIADEPKHPGGLATELGISEATASRHLKLLRTAGLVDVKKTDNCVYYTLQGRAIEALGPTLADVLHL